MRIWILAAVAALALRPAVSSGQGRGPDGPDAAFSVVVGRPTDAAATLSVLSSRAGEAFVEYGPDADRPARRVPAAGARALAAGDPAEFELAGLSAGEATPYRVRFREAAVAGEFRTAAEGRVRTRRPPGAAFTFCLQGDSHPERLGRMYDPGLYERALRNAAADSPDFYVTMGDDFSLDPIVARVGLKGLTREAVDRVYEHQRGFLGLVGGSAALYLVNGNHELAARALLDGTPTSPAVLAGRARVRYFPLPPAPGDDAVYTGNRAEVEHIGLPRDYYAWTWGDALLVVIDPYWHSKVLVDSEPGGKNGDRRGAGEGGGRGGGGGGADGGGRARRDLWGITLGDQQYRWLERTLLESRARFKFVFCHHVLGTGRGGVEVAGGYEWGGADRPGRGGGGGEGGGGGGGGGRERGLERFFQNRPGWDRPIHQLMRDAGVTIFFQGHDHLYARQELDGVVYQTVPNPADPTYTAFNAQAYRSGDILPNSGHVRVSVASEAVKVEYIRAFRPGDEGDGKHNGSVAASYTLPFRTPPAPTTPKTAAPAKETRR